MADILRTFGCQNCSQRFDSWEPNPPCPSCGCVRVSWVPGGGHILGVAPKADAEFRALADTFGMTDMASGGNGAKVKTPQPDVAANSGPVKQFAPGFACTPHAERAVCVPSQANVMARQKVDVGSALPRSRTVPGPAWNARIEGTHRPKAGAG